MHITLVDDSLPFDGFSPANRPLGGAEKAFASLAAALARRGHNVHVYNRARYPMVIEGVHWETMDKPFPAQTDALIAFRKAELLGSVRLAGKRILWATAPGPYIEAARKGIESFSPIVVLNSVAQAQGVTGRDTMPLRLIRPGVRSEYLADLPTCLHERPTAIVTSHPSHGLSALLVLWREQIFPQVPNGRLLVVSASLEKALRTGEVPDSLISLVTQIRMAEDHGVEVTAPRGDVGMAEYYRSARVHLYPGHADDVICWTLMDSQASGLPAVARPIGGVRERILDGQTGQVVPDDAALVNVAVRLLTDEDMFWSMSRDARQMQRDRGWDMAAAEFEALIRAGENA